MNKYARKDSRYPQGINKHKIISEEEFNNLKNNEKVLWTKLYLCPKCKQNCMVLMKKSESSPGICSFCYGKGGK